MQGYGAPIFASNKRNGNVGTTLTSRASDLWKDHVMCIAIKDNELVIAATGAGHTYASCQKRCGYLLTIQSSLL